MKNRQSIIITALALLAVSGNALAQDDIGSADVDQRSKARHHGSRFGGGPEQMILRIAERLDLDETQAQEVRNIMEAARPAFGSLRERSRANRAAFFALDIDDPDYGAKLQDLSGESGELAGELTLLAGQLRADISAVLTVEQRQTLADRMASFAERGPRSRGFRSDR